LPHTTYIAKPGSKFLYSSVGYSILAAALSRAAKQSYVDYVKEHIFKPLKMSHTEFALEENIAPLLAKGYVMTAENTLDGTSALREQQGRGFKVPAGSVYTTVGDMARFIRFELGHGSPEVLSEHALMENYKHQVDTNDFHNGRTMLGYGIGFQVMRGGGHPFIGHGGEIAGYHARGDFDVQSQTGIIVLRNVGGGGIHVFTLKLAGDCLQVLKKSVDTEKKEGPLPAKATSDSK
jgi:CubicO group peptidase (beta-lactamase class C family)